MDSSEYHNGTLPAEFAVSLGEILEASIAITGADFGTVQMVNAKGDGLEIVAQQGFSKEFLEYFQFMLLGQDSSACGRAAKLRERVMIKDVEADPAYAKHLKITRGAGVRALQSTPLFNRKGALLGMLCTYFRESRLPDEKYLHMLDLYVMQAARVIELVHGGKTAARSEKKDGGKKFIDFAESPAGASTLKSISALPFFSDLKDGEKEELFKVARFRHVMRGEYVFMAGDALTHFYWVCTGIVQIFRTTPDGHELTSAIRIAGDVLFDSGTLQRRQRTSNARTVQNATLLSVPVEWLDAHLQSYDRLLNKFLLMLGKQAEQAQMDAEHQATFNAAQIIACFLQHLCVTYHFDPHDFTLPYTKSLIASRLGMELESFSRVLPKLRDLGITVKGKHVSFTNLDAAQSYSCGSCSLLEECPTHKAIQALAKNAANKTELIT